jgi:hypothetical protein
MPAAIATFVDIQYSFPRSKHQHSADSEEKPSHEATVQIHNEHKQYEQQ